MTLSRRGFLGAATLWLAGRALAIPSGYYGPAFDMPHHAQWTRQTKAHNNILVNGQGLLVRTAKAAGRIAVFRHRRALTYECGDAAQAYGGRLSVYRRHLLFLRPGIAETPTVEGAR